MKVQVWDTAGQERYRAITTAYYRDAMGAIIVYDITNQESFNNTARWVQDVRNNTNNTNVNIMLLGNKSDLMKARKVTAENGKIFSRNNDLRQCWNMKDTYINVEFIDKVETLLKVETSNYSKFVKVFSRPLRWIPPMWRVPSPAS